MKKTYLLLLVLTLTFSEYVNAQDTEQFRFYITVGVKPAKVNANQIYIPTLMNPLLGMTSNQ